MGPNYFTSIRTLQEIQQLFAFLSGYLHCYEQKLIRIEDEYNVLDLPLIRTNGELREENHYINNTMVETDQRIRELTVIVRMVNEKDVYGCRIDVKDLSLRYQRQAMS